MINRQHPCTISLTAPNWVESMKWYMDADDGDGNEEDKSYDQS